MSTDLHVVVVDQISPLLGRQCVHDPDSFGFARSAVRGAVDRDTWRTTSVRIFDPFPRPNQPVGCCTGCAKAMQLNAKGNRVRGRVLGMAWALDNYRLNTRRDPFPGVWEPTDTGSSALASCKSAQDQRAGGEYRWLFGGADEVVQAVQPGPNGEPGEAVSIGTWWPEGLFDRKRVTRERGWDRLATPYLVEPTGRRAGGHQYVGHGYHEGLDAVLIRCWWEDWSAYIKREHLDGLLRDNGDAHVQVALGANG